MTPKEIKSVFKEALEEHHSDFYVEAEKHYNHHKQMDICQASKPEWKANHAFVSEVRANSQTAKSVAVKIIITALIGAFITIVVRGLNG